MENPHAESWRLSRRLFAVLRAIVRRSSNGTGSPISEYASRLEGRIGALGRAYEMIMRSPEEGIDLQELIDGELLTHAIPAARYGGAGPDTRIGSEAAMPLALALHELAVNSVLHGAFSQPEGSLEVQWRHLEREGQPTLELTWQETDTREQRHPPTVKGFGLELLERVLPYELDACARIDWRLPGVRIELAIPAGPRSATWRPAVGAMP